MEGASALEDIANVFREASNSIVGCERQVQKAARSLRLAASAGDARRMARAVDDVESASDALVRFGERVEVAASRLDPLAERLQRAFDDPDG